jgi:SAM-dependent methyltransferase
MDHMHEANRRHWDASAAGWRELRDRDQLWRRCHLEPTLAFDGAALAMIHEFVGSLAGKRACVIGSGDNYAAFALAGMGAAVTSTDISGAQLRVAAGRAAELGLEIAFTRCDAADLQALDSRTFDLVCSTNGFLVWIADPARVFSEVHRVLREGGYYILYDIHPFLRPWKDQITPIEMEKPYTDTGPFEYEGAEGPAYEFNWTLSDILNPLLGSGLVLRKMAESSASDPRFWEGDAYLPGTDRDLLDWRCNPRAGLPVWLTLAAQRPQKLAAAARPKRDGD